MEFQINKSPMRKLPSIHRIKNSFFLFLAALITVGCSVPKPKTNSELVEKYRKTVTVASSQIQISYLENGDPSGVLFVLVHGTPGAATGWADYIETPPDNSHVLAIDRLGFGKSTSSKSFPNLKDQVDAIYQITKDKKQIILVGHSLGGPVVAQYAAQYPDQVQSIVFLAGSVDPSLEKIHPMQYFGDWKFIRYFLPSKIRNANEELMGLKAQLEILLPMLQQIKAKVVIVHGDKDDLVPVENVQFLQKHLSSAKCIETIILPGQNHFLPWNSETTVRKAMQMAADKSCK